MSALVMLVYYGARHFELTLMFTDDGLLPLAQAKELFEGKFHTPLFWFPESSLGVQILHFTFLAVLAFLALGVWPRVMAAIGLYLHVLFEHRNFLFMYGFDKVAACWLFYLMFLKSNSHFSLLKRKTESQGLLNSAAFRMAQIHLCVIYGYSGMEKLKGQTWWSGEALWNIISNGIVSPIDMSFMAHVPWLIYIGTFMALFWEVYFPLAVWVPRLRKSWLIFGLIFHFVTAISMNLLFFSLLMVTAYVLLWPLAEPEGDGSGGSTEPAPKSRWAIKK
jgi:hypothetical protein